MEIDTTELTKEEIMKNLEEVLDDNPDPALMAALMSFLDLVNFKRTDSDRPLYELHKASRTIH